MAMFVIFCILDFLSFYLPSYLGACLTLLVASIRYLSAARSSQNKPLTERDISIKAFLVFGCLSTLLLIYISVSTIFDVPFSFIIETCTNTKRNISTLDVFAVQVPHVFNILSLLLDLSQIRFLRKSVSPLLANPNQAVATISGHVTSGTYLLIILLEILLY